MGTLFRRVGVNFIKLSLALAMAHGVLRAVLRAGPLPVAAEAMMTRGEFVVAVQHMFSLPRAEQSTKFTDVSPESPLYSALQAVEPYLGRHILCPGCALSTSFLPSQYISDAEMAFIVTRILVAQNRLRLLSPAEAQNVLKKVPNADQLPLPSRVYFATAIDGGVASLAPDNRLDFKSSQTRVGAAALLDRMQEKFSLPKVHPSR